MTGISHFSPVLLLSGFLIDADDRDVACHRKDMSVLADAANPDCVRIILRHRLYSSEYTRFT